MDIGKSVFADNPCTMARWGNNMLTTGVKLTCRTSTVQNINQECNTFRVPLNENLIQISSLLYGLILALLKAQCFILKSKITISSWLIILSESLYSGAVCSSHSVDCQQRCFSFFSSAELCTAASGAATALCHPYQ